MKPGFYNIVFFSYYLKIFSNDEDSVASSIELKFLKYTRGYWDFLKGAKPKIVDIRNVFFGPCTPSKITKKGYTFKEFKDALKKYKTCKK